MAEANNALPSVAVLGGCGFIGRNLVEYLCDQNLVSKIKVADKSLPALSNLTPKLKKMFKEDDRIVFKQSDLAKDDHVARFFEGENFDYVFNLCGETRPQKTAEDYRLKNVVSAENCLKASVGVKKFVFLSDSRVYASSKSTACKENANIEPWTEGSKADLQVENILREQQEVPYVILRPALVYGPGDQQSLMPRIMSAAVYQDKKEKMKFLWNAKVHTNCVHVLDVARAMWLCATSAESGKVYNLADKSQLNQGGINDLLVGLFDIEVGFVNKLMSMGAKKMMKAAADHSNDKHVPGWADLCMKHNILNTPLSPYMDVEILKKEHVHVDGSLIEQELKFEYAHPQATLDLVRASVQQFIDQGLFPPVLKNS